ncbi:hypothetical protein [Pseudomonas syringae group sp. J309-1]|uniref:hypothetical protein n=1 Tax=Pseudomonas syringae group sp. J309-1 TaxID=3079588 RepID=UPI0029080850|nr:hypothetical protein [Pseudomonas syringae group sp. J309-1]MDU8361086.1 hypothetical protein [Pseudomonas syringae group sp. J309-1]
MGKRKIYIKTDLTIPEVRHSVDQDRHTFVPHEVIPPTNTQVAFGRNATRMRFYDFARWYGSGIDQIVYACHKQIERFLAKQDAEVEASTVTSYCKTGLRTFLDFLLLQATALQRELTLSDINRDLIDSYIAHNADCGLAISSQQCRLSYTKSVLQALGRRGIINLIDSGDSATFPLNPFPNSNRTKKGEVPLLKQQRQEFAAAVKQAVMPIWDKDFPVTSELVSYALLIIALHTGRNTTPLLEMSRDCLRAHPKDNNTFLVLWKRRGHNNSKVILRADSTHERLLEVTPTIKTNVDRLIRHLIFRTAELVSEAPSDLQDRVWLYRSRAYNQAGQVTALTLNQLEKSIERLINEYQLTESNGSPLRLNISRLRKTFGNRVFELLDGDLTATATALGNSPQVADTSYLLPTIEAKNNWRFMGQVLVKELLSYTIGATFKKVPTGLCRDPENGQYAPKKEGATCINFLNCVRCRHYVVTAEDLYKLFSFYFRILSERNRVDKRRWQQYYAHIPRLIDDYIVAEGLKRGIFSNTVVEQARTQARAQPHPFWSYDLITSLEVFV